MMDFALQEIRGYIASMKEGERVTIPRSLLREVQTNWFTGQSAVDRVLEGIVGSSYSIRHWTNPVTMDVTFERVKEDGRKWNEPGPDRKHLFKRQADGSLAPK